MDGSFVDDAASFVDDVLTGYVQLHSGVLRYARDGEARCVFRRVLDANVVALLSGGGSGHEPAHAGFVGSGMLSGAVCGAVFASPTSSSVLRAILEAASPAGVLLIVKNYTGDRINFGVAEQRARAMGVRVDTVVVADDVALPLNTVTGRRGLAGTLFVHKIAGAAAAAGLSLDDVAAEARAAASAVATVGVALSRATVPGSPASQTCRIPSGCMDYGGGIHGEAGAEQIAAEGAAATVNRMIHRLLHNEHVDIPAGSRVAMLVNSLGATSPGELALLGGLAIASMRRAGLAVMRCYTGALMTSLDAHGVSISLLRIDNDTMLQRLDADTSAPAWPRALPLPVDTDDSALCVLAKEPPSASTADDTHAGPPVTPLGRSMCAAIAAAAHALVALEQQLDAWDTVSGDGDCGSTLARGARAVLSDLPAYKLDSLPHTLAGLAGSVRAAVGGTSGALLDVLFTAAEAHARNATETATIVGALDAGVQALMRVGGAHEGMRTMVDALMPAVRACSSCPSDASPSAIALAAAIAAEAGAEATRAMIAKAGRASYVESGALLHAGVPDPGAYAVAAVLRAVASELK